VLFTQAIIKCILSMLLEVAILNDMVIEIQIQIIFMSSFALV
jgi:hypothetical protein